MNVSDPDPTDKNRTPQSLDVARQIVQSGDFPLPSIESWKSPPPTSIPSTGFFYGGDLTLTADLNNTFAGIGAAGDIA